MIGLFNLDFDDFKKYYETSGHKLNLRKENINEFAKIPYFEKLANDLGYLNIDKNDFSDVIKFIYKFFSSYSHEIFKVYFTYNSEINNSLVVDVILNVSVEIAVDLTLDFNDDFVEYAFKSGRNDYLSKFSIYFKPSYLYDAENPGYISGLNTPEEII